ncbi:SDR family oxidoreductase [Actinospica durhamensis]|uniref:SDR family oxidoreductase n=1 Tax=Actinospica durhamensis TaxID=1508375 RepID=A0A941EJV5_9ACTN|nr:SDR family oxidoreductase [Actinospica durhamensis]MBR7832711.1 SDR family oxidoreductase [Actinospica durhamensis]
MELDGAGVVVTGAAAGIGEALARRFAAAGARVVVADLDGPGVTRVAESIGALAVPGDAASAEGVAHLVAAARAHLGEIDLYCANAGVGGASSLDDEAGWDLAWQVNVLAHVRAARELLPAWLERGSGRFLATVSAAGLLTMLGAPAYSATKHGALAFAEWLSATYADRGVVVQALCPQGVRTAMLEASGKAGELLLAETAITPEAVADAVMAGLDGESFLILPHPEVAAYYAGRAADTDRWLAGMRRAQRLLD